MSYFPGSCRLRSALFPRIFPGPATLIMALSLLTVGLTSAGAGAETSLWKVQGPKNTVYLLGSVHILRASDHPLPEAMEAAYKDSASLVLEVSTKDMTSPETAALTMQLGAFQDGQTLKSSLKPETYALLEAKAREAGLPLAMLNSFKPWLAGMTVMVQQLVQSGYEASKGVDKHFEGKAVADGKKIEALETVKFQLELFDRISTGMGDEFIRHILDESEQVTAMVDQTVELWKSGQGEKLQQVMLESFRDYPEVRGPLLDDRNQDWARKLHADHLKRSENVLVVVGTGHLVGPGSVVDLLQKQGYTIEQL